MGRKISKSKKRTMKKRTMKKRTMKRRTMKRRTMKRNKNIYGGGKVEEFKDWITEWGKQQAVGMALRRLEKDDEQRKLELADLEKKRGELYAKLDIELEDNEVMTYEDLDPEIKRTVKEYGDETLEKLIKIIIPHSPGRLRAKLSALDKEERDQLPELLARSEHFRRELKTAKESDDAPRIAPRIAKVEAELERAESALKSLTAKLGEKPSNIINTFLSMKKELDTERYLEIDRSVQNIIFSFLPTLYLEYQKEAKDKSKDILSYKKDVLNFVMKILGDFFEQQKAAIAGETDEMNKKFTEVAREVSGTNKLSTPNRTSFMKSTEEATEASSERVEAGDSELNIELNEIVVTWVPATNHLKYDISITMDEPERELKATTRWSEVVQLQKDLRKEWSKKGEIPKLSKRKWTSKKAQRKEKEQEDRKDEMKNFWESLISLANIIYKDDRINIFERPPLSGFF